MEQAEVLSKADQEALAKIAGKYLTFTLDEEVYGIEILKVQEIIGMMPVTPVPRAPRYVRGVINLRGKVIPVIDLRSKFGMEPRESTSRTCIIVMQVKRDAEEVTMGIIVDEVSEVLDIAVDQLESTPSFGSDVETDFIRGMGKVGKRVVILLEMDEVLSDADVTLALPERADAAE